MNAATYGYEPINISEKAYKQAFEQGEAIQYLWKKVQGTGINKREVGRIFLKHGHAIQTANNLRWFNFELVVGP